MSHPYITTLDNLSLSSYPKKKNEDIHTIIQTNKFTQVTTVYLDPQKSIGFERHINPESDQIVQVLEGKGLAMLGSDENDKELQIFEINHGSFLTIPAGVRHEIYNTDEDNPMKLLIIYSPPIH